MSNDFVGYVILVHTSTWTVVLSKPSIFSGEVISFSNCSSFLTLKTLPLNLENVLQVFHLGEEVIFSFFEFLQFEASANPVQLKSLYSVMVIR